MKTTRDRINKYLSMLKDGEDCLQDFIVYSRGYIQYIAYKYLLDKSLVEDVVFSVYDKILRTISTFDSSQNGLAWVVKIAQNEAFKLNRGYREQSAFTEQNVNACALESCENKSIDKYDLDRAIERLDERERNVIYCKIFLDMTIREIAVQTDMPKSTVAHILKQALKKLEKYLE